MPYIEGESLRERLEREGPLPLDDALRITREVASALSDAHGHNVVHRDIKPENILLSGGEAVVADFGIARAITRAAGSGLTETGIPVGTPAYMSPEQASGGGLVDGRSDIYSLGCVLYEMLAGEPPYTGASAQVVIAKRFTDPVPSVRRLRDTIPPAIDGAVSKALGKAPADRFVTAAQFAEALTPSAARAVRPHLFARRVFAVGAVTAAVGALAVAAMRWRAGVNLWLCRGGLRGRTHSRCSRFSEGLTKSSDQHRGAGRLNCGSITTRGWTGDTRRPLHEVTSPLPAATPARRSTGSLRSRTRSARAVK